VTESVAEPVEPRVTLAVEMKLAVVEEAGATSTHSLASRLVAEVLSAEPV